MALEQAAWRARFRDPSELKRASQALAAAAMPDGVEAGLGEFHCAWYSLAMFEHADAWVRHDRAYAHFERSGYGLGLDRLRAVKALLLKREGRSGEALQGLDLPRHAAEEETLAEARYIALNLRALCHGDLGDLDECLRYFSAALAVARQAALPAFEANALGNLGGFHADIHNFEEAERMCRRAFALADEVGARGAWATSGTNWMLALFYLGRFQDAKAVALQLLAREHWMLQAKRGAYYTKFAAVFLHAGELTRAVAFLAEANAAMDPAVSVRTVEWYWVTAEILNAQSRFAEAEAMCRKAMLEASDFTEVSLPTDLMRLYNAATCAAEALGDFQSALRYKKEAFEKYETLVGQSARAKRLTLEIEYEIQHAEWQRDQAQQEQRIAEEEQVRATELNRALEAANVAKSRFLAAASHDLRQPVHAVGLFADTLVALCEPGESRELVTRIQQSMRAMNGMLSELLDISTLNAGTTRAAIVALPITRVLLHIDNEFGAVARARGLDLRLTAPDAWVRSDPVLLTRVLQNLVANALAYTVRGGVLVTARVRGDAVLLDVWDTGVGIDEAHLPRIYDEFYQIGNVSRDRRKGMGLGLAIVRRLVDLLEHPLEVRSRVGRGTRFRVTLPLAKAEAAPAPSSERAVMDLSGKVSLVVDDEPDIRDSMAAALAARGCRVLVAASARAACATLAETSMRPDFVVMDYRLETQTGLAALAEIRAFLGQHVPALIVTGDTLASDLMQFAQAGEAWLIKPVSVDDLQHAVTALLMPTPSLSVLARDGGQA